MVSFFRVGLPTVLLLVAVSMATTFTAFGQNLVLSLPDIEGSVGDEVTIAVQGSDMAGKGVASYVIGITYDNSILDDAFSANSLNGTISAGGSTSIYQTDGEFRVIYARNITDPITDDGTLFSVTTTVIGDGTTPLRISSVSYMEGASGRIDYDTVDGSLSTEASHNDSDGVSDAVEDAVPNPDGSETGDGNGDGTPDSEQANVASLRNGSGVGYVTIASDAGTNVENVTATSTPPAPAPDGVNLPDGVVSFNVSNVSSGGSSTVKIYTSNEVTGYYKYGPTPDDPSDHWYLFNYDGTTGAQIEDGVITLHFVDGQRGDADLTANGVIDDPGAPAFYTNAAPSAAVITSPSDGTEWTIGGGDGDDPEDPSTTLFTIQWDASTDSDGDDVTYEVQVSVEESFSSTLATVANGAATELAVTVGQAADWFDEAAGGADVGSSETLYFRVVSSDGTAETTSETTSATFVRGTVTSAAYGELPGGFELKGNYPNPFNPSTTIRFDLPESANVTVEVFDILGRQVLSVPATSMQAGADRSIRIDAGQLSSGNYLYKVTAETATDTMVRVGRMTFMK